MHVSDSRSASDQPAAGCEPLAQNQHSCLLRECKAGEQKGCVVHQQPHFPAPRSPDSWGSLPMAVGPVLPHAVTKGAQEVVTQAGRVLDVPTLAVCRLRTGIRRVWSSWGPDLLFLLLYLHLCRSKHKQSAKFYPLLSTLYWLLRNLEFCSQGGSKLHIQLFSQ